MKFLLTSAGITNKSIAQAVLDLVGLAAEKIKVAFVPTAADRYEGDKGWLIDNLSQFKAQGYAQVDIVDIAAMSKAQSLPRLEAAHVICFGGGSEYHLLTSLREKGLDIELPRLLETRVHVGISAGSMIAGHFIDKDVCNWLYLEAQIPEEFEKPYGFVDCIILPHLNSEYTTRVRKENLDQLRGKYPHPIYVLDDQSALTVVDGKIEVISEGEWITF